MIPDSTSPDPAVAAQDCPAGLRYAGPPGSAIDGDVAFQQHGGPERVGELAGGADAVVAGWVRRPAGRTRRRAASARSARDGRRACRDARRGWSARRRRRAPAGRCPARTTVRPRRFRRCRARGRRPRPAPARRRSAVGDAITSGQCATTSLRRASRVAHHARRGGDGGAGAQDRRTRVGRRAGQHAGDALGVLVVVRPRHRPARGDVGRLEADEVGVGQVEADVDQLDPAAIAKRVNGLEAAERHGQRGVDVPGRRRRRWRRRCRWGGRRRRPGCRRHRPPRRRRPRRAAAVREPEMPTTPSMTRSVVAATLSTTRPPACVNAARPFAMRRDPV